MKTAAAHQYRNEKTNDHPPMPYWVSLKLNNLDNGVKLEYFYETPDWASHLENICGIMEYFKSQMSALLS